MRKGCVRARYLGVLMILLMSAATAVVVVSRTQRMVHVLVRSNPARASVFDDCGEVGATPVRMALAPGDRRSLRLVKRDHRDAEICVEANDYLPHGLRDRLRRLAFGIEGEVMVHLVSSATSALVVTTEPAGAEMFLDGRRVGMTPFSREKMSPGRRMLRIEHPECFPETVNLVLEPGEPTRVHRVLRSKVVALYRDLIAKQPGSLMHHTDLAHYYVLKGDFDGAVAALRSGLDALKRPDATDKTRYFSELWKIHTRYYSYPAEKGKPKLRPLCRELMETVLEKKLGNPKQIRNFLKRMKAYDKRNPPG